MLKARQTCLGDLDRGRLFRFMGRQFEVRKNLGAAGVVVRSTATRTVSLEGRTFVANGNNTETWSASAVVEAVG